jgi:hypothetical protein
MPVAADIRPALSATQRRHARRHPAYWDAACREVDGYRRDRLRYEPSLQYVSVRPLGQAQGLWVNEAEPVPRLLLRSDTQSLARQVRSSYPANDSTGSKRCQGSGVDSGTVWLAGQGFGWSSTPRFPHADPLCPGSRSVSQSPLPSGP